MSLEEDLCTAENERGARRRKATRQLEREKAEGLRGSVTEEDLVYDKDVWVCDGESVCLCMNMCVCVCVCACACVRVCVCEGGVAK